MILQEVITYLLYYNFFCHAELDSASLGGGSFPLAPARKRSYATLSAGLRFRRGETETR